MLPTMQVFVEDVIYVSQGDIIMSVGDALWGVGLCPAPEFTSRSVQPRGASDYPQQNLTAKL